MSPMFRYSVLRVGLFVVTLLILSLLGVRGWLGLILAAVISLGLSYVLLSGLRDEVAQSVADRVERRIDRKQRVDEATAAEDREDDARRGD